MLFGLLVAMLAFGAISRPVSASAVASCNTRDFRIQNLRGQGALGTFLLPIAYRNVSDRPCVTAGYPGITLYSRGQRLAVAVRVRVRHSTLTVNPGQRVISVVGYPHLRFGRRRCLPVTGLGVYAPDSSQFVRVRVHNASVLCANGAEVYPMARSVRGSV